MHPRHLLATGLVAAAVAVSFRAADTPTALPGAPDPQPAALPDPPGDDASLAFEANVGQTDARVRFLSRGAGYTLFLAPTEAVLRLTPGRDGGDGDRTRRAAGPAAVVRLSLANANPAPAVTGVDALAATTHYFVGRDPAGWHRDVASYAKVRYREVYPGIDALYYGNGGQLEYDFVVAPGADPGVIALEFAGVDSVRVDDAGHLRLGVGDRDLVQQRPVVYQMVDGARRLVQGAYALLGGGRVGFTLGDFDAALPLVIDPVLSYSTYLGGDGLDHAEAATVDRAGNTWVVGSTDSVEFPWTLGIDSEYGGGDADAYVCRFSAMGGTPLCAYIGGEGWDEAWAVAVGPDGNAHVAGYTASRDFPTLNAAQPELVPGEYGDAFVLKINDRNDGLEYSTYLGGNDSDVVRAMTVGDDGAAYVTGSTWSWQGFPTTAGALQASDPAGEDAFVAKFADSGALVFNSYLGGSVDDRGRGIVVDGNDRVYVTGNTFSEDFPVRTPLQATHAGAGDGFVAVLRPDGGRLLYGTYLGGSGEDWVYDLRLDAARNMHLSGFTWSADFPLANPLQGVAGGDRDGLLARISADGSTLQYATYLGGSGGDDLRHMVLDGAGNMIVAGYTTSPDFPLVDSLQPLSGQDGVVLKVSADGQRLLSSTALGGADYEVLTGVAIDLDGTVHVTGWTASNDFPLAAAFQDGHANPPTDEAGGEDIFVSRIADLALDSWRGDFDGDGRDDILWRNNATGQGAIWPAGNRAAAVNLSRVGNVAWRIVGVGDFDADGKSDLLWRNAETGANTIWPGAIGADAVSVTGVSNMDWQVHGVGDFDGDGRDDILWHQSGNGQTAVWFEGRYEARANLTRVTNLGWDIVGAGDFDGDGRDDVLWRNGSSGQNTIWSGGDSRAVLPVARLDGHEWQIAGIGDFQGDGKDDILWRNVSNGRNAVWRGGSRAHQQAVRRVSNQRWAIYGTGDYDGDGKDDILWRESLRGGNAVWRGGNAGNVLKVLPVRSLDWTIKS